MRLLAIAILAVLAAPMFGSGAMIFYLLILSAGCFTIAAFMDRCTAVTSNSDVGQTAAKPKAAAKAKTSKKPKSRWEPVRAKRGSRPFGYLNMDTGELKKYRPEGE